MSTERGEAQLKRYYASELDDTDSQLGSGNWFACKACQVGFGAVAVALFAALQLIPGVDVVVDSGEGGAAVVAAIDAAAEAAGETVDEYLETEVPSLSELLEKIGIDPDKLLSGLSALGSFTVGGLLQMICGPGAIGACS